MKPPKKKPCNTTKQLQQQKAAFGTQCIIIFIAYLV